jgi:hypothetical protein
VLRSLKINYLHQKVKKRHLNRGAPSSSEVTTKVEPLKSDYQANKPDNSKTRTTQRVRKVSAELRALKSSLRRYIKEGFYRNQPRKETGSFIERLRVFLWLTPTFVEGDPLRGQHYCAASSYTKHLVNQSISKELIGSSMRSPFGLLYRKVVVERQFPSCLLGIGLKAFAFGLQRTSSE